MKSVVNKLTAEGQAKTVTVLKLLPLALKFDVDVLVKTYTWADHKLCNNAIIPRTKHKILKQHEQ